MISLAWSISVLWVLPIIGWAHFFNDGVRLVPPDKCNTEYDKNIFFKMATAICNFYMPLIAMISINTKIYLVIRKRYENPIMDPNGEFSQKGGAGCHGYHNRRHGPFDNILLECLWNVFNCYKNKKHQQHRHQQQSQMLSQTQTNDVTNQSVLIYKRNSFEKPSQSSSLNKTSRYNNNHLTRAEKSRLQVSVNDDDDNFSVSLSTASNTCSKHAFSILRRQDSQKQVNSTKPGANITNTQSHVKSASNCYGFSKCFRAGSSQQANVQLNSDANFQSSVNVNSDVQVTVKYSKAEPSQSPCDLKSEKAKSASFKLNRLNNTSKSSRCSGERSISRMYQERCKLPENSIRITRLIDSSTNPTANTATSTDQPNGLNNDDLSRISPIYSKPDPKFFEPSVNLIHALNATYGTSLEPTSEEPKEAESSDKTPNAEQSLIDSNNNIKMKENDNSSEESSSSKNLPSPDAARLADGDSEMNHANKSDASSRTTIKKLSNQSNTGSHSKSFFTSTTNNAHNALNSSSRSHFKSTLTMESKVNARKGFMNKQEKAFKQLGAIVIGFTLCFLPYFIVFLIVAICEDCVNEDIFTLTVWLGYLNSTINPFLYALSNKKYIRSIRARSIFGRRNAKKMRKHKKPATSKDAPLA